MKLRPSENRRSGFMQRYNCRGGGEKERGNRSHHGREREQIPHASELFACGPMKTADAHAAASATASVTTRVTNVGLGMASERREPI